MPNPGTRHSKPDYRMILADFLPAIPDRLWTLARQTGISHAICKCAPELTGMNPPWDIDSLRSIKKRFEDAGFTLYGLEGDQFDMSRIKQGLPGRDEDIERYRQMLRNMGELGIPLLCYNFMAGLGWHRTRTDLPSRGGALVTEFNLADVPAAEKGLTSEQVWENYEYFLQRVLPTAEASGVKMGMHPDDPPLPEVRGMGRILCKPENFDRALALSNSPSHGVTFCQANFKLMGGDIEPLVRRWAQRIVFVHFRDVRGTAERFEETFHDDGPTDMPAMLKLYHEVGFAGPIRVDHVPTMAGEDNSQPSYGALGRLFATGYLKGALQALRIPFK